MSLIAFDLNLIGVNLELYSLLFFQMNFSFLSKSFLEAAQIKTGVEICVKFVRALKHLYFWGFAFIYN